MADDSPTTESALKRCFRCGRNLSRSNFGRQSQKPDGLHPNCRSCVSASRAAKPKDSRETQKKHEYDAARYPLIRERKLRMFREYNKKNSANNVAKAAKWRSENIDRARQLSRYSSAKRRSLFRSGVSAASVADWVNERPKVCYWCKANCRNKYHVDHYIPLSKGGAHEIGNMVISCPTCNVTKQATCPFEFALTKGMLL